MYILHLKIISNPKLCFEIDTSEVILNVVVNKNWTVDTGHIIIKVRLFIGLFMFCFSILPLVVMCLLLDLFVLKLK